MKSLNDFIRGIKSLENFPEIEKATEEIEGLNVLSVALLAAMTDDNAIVETLENIELSAAYFLFADIGVLNKASKRALYLEDIDVYGVGEEHHPYTHQIKTEKFSILVNQ